MDTMRDKAEQLFKEGYNCSQSVFAAFSDRYGIDRELALKLSASFGAGMGRMREVCGAVSGMMMVVGLETGATVGADQEGKKHNYDIVQALAAKFREQNGSIICREILGLDQGEKKPDVTNTTPEARNEEYYKKRPCLHKVGDAAEILEEFLKESPDNKRVKRS